MRTSCLPKPFPLGAGPGWGEVGTVQVVAAWLLFPNLQKAFPPGFVLSECCWYSWDPTLEPSHLGVPMGWGTGSSWIWDVPLSHLLPAQHSFAWIRICSKLALFVSGARLWVRLPQCSSLGLSFWCVLSIHWDLESCSTLFKHPGRFLGIQGMLPSGSGIKSSPVPAAVSTKLLTGRFSAPGEQ